METSIDINAKNLPRFERKVAMDLSEDSDAKAAGESKRLNVTFVIEAGWSLNEVVDRLLTITTSPRVAYQNGNRAKAIRPSIYIVPKAGSRAVVDPERVTLDRAAVDEAYRAEIRRQLDEMDKAAKAE